MTPTLKDANLITRRDAILRVTALLGGVALVGGSSLLTGCRDSSSGVATATAFSPEDVGFLDELAETILPATKTPGAKDAKVGAFVAMMVTETYSPEDQKIFRDGMRVLDDASKKANGVSFMAATPTQRLALLNKMDAEQKAYSDAREAAKREAALKRAGLNAPVMLASGGGPVVSADAPAHHFRMLKELVLLGYFTSEIGCTQAQRYVEAPGKFEPCLPYAPGEKSWAAHA